MARGDLTQMESDALLLQKTLDPLAIPHERGLKLLAMNSAQQEEGLAFE